MDKITQNLVEDYIAASESRIANLDDRFELFSTYCILSRDYEDEDYDIEQIWLNDDSIGIDAIAIIVNGRLVESIEEVDDSIAFNGYLDAKFIFVQSKTSSSFDAKEVGNFLLATSDFFEDQPQLPQSVKVARKAEIMNHIYSLSAKMTKGSPVCKLYYITTGSWQDDPVIQATFDKGKGSLEDMNLFSSVSISPVDARSIQRFYQDSKATISRQILFSNRIKIPEIASVEQAYVGTS